MTVPGVLVGGDVHLSKLVGLHVRRCWVEQMYSPMMEERRGEAFGSLPRPTPRGQDQ